MKILIFCPYYPPHTGGLENHADEFNKYLSQKGVDIIVFTPRLPKDAPEYEIRYSGVKIIRFPAFEIVSNYPLPKFWKIKFWNLFFGLFKVKFDIVISRTRFFSTSILALIYAKIRKTRPHTKNSHLHNHNGSTNNFGAGVNWIHIEHGSDFVRLSNRLKTIAARLYDYTFGCLIFNLSDTNISISKAVQKFVRKFDKRESPVIYRGLDIEEIDKIQPDEKIRNEYAGKTIISFVGRLYKWKGVENSIEAIRSLPKEIKNKTVFLIIGGGEDFLTLEKLSSGEDCIQMLGNLPHEKAIAILKNTDIYLHSAQPGGGLSTSLLEAMYCGCAVIATPNEGADEVIENNLNGFLIEKSNVEMIAKRLQHMLKTNLEQYKKTARNSIKENFEWKKTIEKYMSLFYK